MFSIHSSSTPRVRRGATRTMAVALLAVVGLAGMGVGFAADRLALHRRGDDARRPGPMFGPPEGRRGMEPRRADGMRERFAHELELTPGQARRVDSIMAQQAADFRRLRQAMQPRFDSVLARSQARLDSVLTPEQRRKLDALRAREVFGPRDTFGGHERRPPPLP